MKTTTLTCSGCGVPFEKPTNEANRQLRKNPDRKFYCTSSCYGNNEAKHHLEGHRAGTDHLDPGNRRDDFSSFRYFMKKARNRKCPTDLDLPYLKKLWENQDGVCPLTGMEMVKHPTVQAWELDKGNPWKPSLDRIDSSLGYVRGNVRFIVSIANFCKNGWGDDEVIKFCRAVTDHQ